MAEPRPGPERAEHARRLLAESAADAWVATASADGQPYLVPLSLCWDGERIVLATVTGSLTVTNIVRAGRARLALGGTRDVVMVDAELLSATALAETPPEVADAYATQADWDPRRAGGEFTYLVLRPIQVQAWREANEIRGRTVMRDATWLY